MSEGEAEGPVGGKLWVGLREGRALGAEDGAGVMVGSGKGGHVDKGSGGVVGSGKGDHVGQGSGGAVDAERGAGVGASETVGASDGAAAGRDDGTSYSAPAPPRQKPRSQRQPLSASATQRSV